MSQMVRWPTPSHSRPSGRVPLSRVIAFLTPSEAEGAILITATDALPLTVIVATALLVRADVADLLTVTLVDTTALAVTCPYCRAKVGQPCWTLRNHHGQPVTRTHLPHKSRLKLAWRESQ